MASESRGKSIALGIFVALTAITTTSWYYFFETVDRLEQTQKGAEANASAAAKRESEINRLTTEVSEQVFGAGQKTADEVKTAVEADLGSPKTNSRRQGERPKYESYTDAVSYLTNELNISDLRKVALLEDNQNLQRELSDIERKYQIEVDEADRALQNKVQEYDQESGKLQAMIDGKDKEILEYKKQLQDKRLQLQQVLNDIERDEDENEKLITSKRKIIEKKSRSERLLGQLHFEASDGYVVQTNPDLKQVTLNLGYQDNVVPGLTFSVYDPVTKGNPYRLPKANIEVARIEGPHRSIASVTTEHTGLPVLRGDLIYNPVWSSNRGSRVAFVGLVYIDDDDQEDNEQFRKLIERYTGKVDAYVPNKLSGNITGEITIDTDWLLIGDIPKASDSEFGTVERNQVNQALTEATTKMRLAAQAHGVRVLHVRNFLTFMGYETRQRLVREGGEEDYFFGRSRPKIVDTEPVPAIRDEQETE